jgi:hypothetical protein
VHLLLAEYAPHEEIASMQENNLSGRVEKNRRPEWMRWVDIALRTGHIGVAALLFGGFYYDIPFARVHTWHHLTIATGIGLLVLEFVQDHNWPHRGKGLLGIIHVSLAGFIHIRPDLAVPLLWAIVITGCIGSHMQRKFRHWSILYGKEIR